MKFETGHVAAAICKFYGHCRESPAY